MPFVCISSHYPPKKHLLDILEGNSSLSLEFTEYCLSMRKCQGLKFLSQRFMEMQLRRLTTSSDEVEISRLEQSILSLIENKKLEYKQALVYCRQFNFTAGLVKLLSAGPGGDLTDLLSVLLESSQNEEALQLCKKNGRENTGLWRKAILYWSSRSNYDGVQKILAEAIPAASDCIDLSALINMLKSSSAPIAILKPLILKKLEQDDVDIKKCESRILKLTTSIDKQKEKRKNLLQQASIFKLSKCKLCGKDLSLPSVHFLCGHSFHHHCFTTYIDQDGECPICAQQNRQVLQALKLPEQSRVSEEKFLGQVGKSSDSFGTIIEMLARGEIITHRKKSERSSENFETEPKPVSNKLLANRARIATELKFGLTPETPKSFSGKSPKTNAVKAILEVPPEEKPFDIQLSRPAIQPAENPFGESIDNASDSELNPFGDANEDEEEIKIAKDFQFSNPFGESTAELTGNPFGEDESDSPGLILSRSIFQTSLFKRRSKPFRG